jgi:hypothetical protein
VERGQRSDRRPDVAIGSPSDRRLGTHLPINEQVSFFDWHFPAAEYVGGLVDNSTGDVYLAVVAGDPESALMRSAAGTLLFMLTADRPGDTALFSEAHRSFVADPQAGATDYVMAGPLGIAVSAFDGVEPGAPWVAVAAASPTDEERALVEAAVVAGLVAGTAAPPAPAPRQPGAAHGDNGTCYRSRCGRAIAGGHDDIASRGHDCHLGRCGADDVGGGRPSRTVASIDRLVRRRVERRR